MAIKRTKTIKNKHAANKSGIKGSKATRATPMDGIVKKKKGPAPNSKAPTSAKAAIAMLKKKKKVWSEKELGIPTLNMITPVGVEKPKGKKKGKVFVDDSESMHTILALVQADKNGEIESKMMKARQMEEIREARKVEAEKKEQERATRLEDTKDSLRKKRSRSKPSADAAEEDEIVKDALRTTSKATKTKKRRVAFA